jgi:transcriptional regulator with XRE-family HTH domain
MKNIRDSLTLKACRIIAGVKADEIASATGVNIETVYKWERGGSFPNVPQMNKIIELYAKKGYAVDVNDINFFS